MSARIDVLAVMEEAELALQDLGCSVTWDKVRKARAAVAELIEAVSAERAVGHREYSDLAEARKRTEAALARVRGAA